ncbi:MAG: hypothetical protein DRH26_01770 [Deltaproteobacteria bacterium]|nr:MAG: hypothetical protein DRH26_01770 [Deltaproteobacteria bacterium]
MEYALGVLGLLPWDFYRFTITEYRCKIKGFEDRNVSEKKWETAKVCAIVQPHSKRRLDAEKLFKFVDEEEEEKEGPKSGEQLDDILFPEEVKKKKLESLKKKFERDTGKKWQET